MASKWVGVGGEDVAALIDIFEWRLLKWAEAIRPKQEVGKGEAAETGAAWRSKGALHHKDFAARGK